MNIHLLRSPELNEETYRNVLHLLQRFRGPMKFLECEEEILEYTDDYGEKLWENKEDFERLMPVQMSYCEDTQARFQIKFPHREKIMTWKQLFSECNAYRKQKDLPENDIVIILTDLGNDLNWFGGVSPSMTNYFIQTSNWQHFFGSSIDIRFPIAYEVISWLMRYCMFSSDREILKSTHEEPIGCIMDFCQNKSQIILKMRTGDLCENCMKTFIGKDVSPLYTRQFFETLDGIREAMTFRGRSVLFQQPSKLEIKGYTKKIFFSELGNLELRLNPKEKTVYFLFLNHPEGINLNELSDHREELKKMYGQFSNQSNPKSIERAIELLVDPSDNDINIILSRINKKIKEAVGEPLQDFYSIRGERGEKKLIKLERELVVNLNN